MGLAALVERSRVPSRVVAGAVTGGLVVGAAIVQLMYTTGLDKPGPGVRVVLPIYWTALIVVIVSTGVLLGSWLLARRVGWLRGAAPVLVVSLVLLLGTSMFLRTTYDHATVRSGPSRFYAETVTPDGIAATDWLRAHVPAEEVLATNGHCPAGDANPRGACLHLTFWLSAFAQRRTLVSGWGYLPSAAAEASKAGIWPGSTPFFDPARLAANDEAIYEPTAAGLAELRHRYSVSWLVVDRTVGIESPQLRDLATLRFERGDYAVYEIR